MSTFSQWWKSYSKTGTVKQFTWLCGSERVLVDEIVLNIKKTIDPAPWNYERLSAEEDAPDVLWGAILQYPIEFKPRLVVVNESQRLDQTRVIDLLKKRRLSPQTYVVFVSSDVKIPMELKPDGKKQRPDYLRAFSGKGDVIECGPFTQTTAKHAIEWVRSMKKMRDGVASHLLERANGDIRLTRDLCRKLALFPQEPTLSMVNELLREYPRDSFANALLALDRKTALLALKDLPESEYSSAVGLLESNVDLAGLVHDMLVSHKSQSEITRAAGSRRFLVSDIMPVARHYDSRRRASIRTLLADVDEYLRLGERTATMELLVAMW